MSMAYGFQSLCASLLSLSTIWGLSGEPVTLDPPSTTGDARAVETQTPQGAAASTQPAADKTLGETKPADRFHSFADLQHAPRLIFLSVDQNHDGVISQEEARDAANGLLGSLFFSADADGDGKITLIEAKEMERKYRQRHPRLRIVITWLERKGKIAENDLLKTTFDIIDNNSDKAISSAEIRQLVDVGLDSLYESADVDQDGLISAEEWRRFLHDIVLSSVDNIFRTADADENQSLSKEELTNALTAPARALFEILDVNDDGELTEKELEQSGQILSQLLQSLTPNNRQNAIENHPNLDNSKPPELGSPPIRRPK